MSDTPAVDYRSLGLFANPFPAPGEGPDDRPQIALVTRAAANALIGACLRARTADGSVPVLVDATEEVPDFYYRLATSDFLARSSSDPSLDMMTLTIPLEMMRVGTIRGCLTEFAELVAAADLPATTGAYFADVLREFDDRLPESAAVTPEEVEAVRVAFETDAAAAFDRYFVRVPEGAEGSLGEDDALHEVYLRQVGQQVEIDADAEGDEGDPATPPPAAVDDMQVPAEPFAPDEAMRDYLLAYVDAHLSRAIARGLRAHRGYGEGMVAQEFKVTKAPRKTIGALVEFMSHRFARVAGIYEKFDSWPLLDEQTRDGVLRALGDLSEAIGRHGVFGAIVMDGVPEPVVERFGAGIRVDWRMTGLNALYDGDVRIDRVLVDSWLAAASLTGTSPWTLDGPELTPLLDACGDDVRVFAAMARAAIDDAAARGVRTLDDTARAAGMAVGEVGD